ncbi:MAG TPA: CHAT domain-containing protein [Pyrinomonadaceae bacterium]|nr:CHAT domain-containing protein [Pyrinomonadaceae bacterium]
MARADKNSITEYLLGRLTEAEEEQVELRLLTDPEFAEEYDTVVNETVDDYVSGKFEGEELKQVEDYFFKSPERKNKLKFALALKLRKSELVNAKPRIKNYTRSLAIAASILIVIGAGFGIHRIFFYQSDLNKGLVALRTAFKDERPTEPRLSDFDYAPIPNQRGEPAKVDYVQRDLAASLLLKEVNQHPSAASHHALGQYYLANREFDKAIDQLDQAVALDANNVKILSDLGAAWLEKGKRDLETARSDPSSASAGHAVMELAKSLEYLNRAGSLPEALFNRALYHQYMRSSVDEEADWREYLKKDPNSQWAAEAKQRLKFLEEQRKQISESKEQKLERFRDGFRIGDDAGAWELLSSYHNRSGNLIVEQLLDSYLAAEARGAHDEAKAELSALIYSGNLSQQKVGDSFFSDLVQSYVRARPNQKTQVAQARALMKAGHEGWGEAKVQDSLETFKQARQLFEQAGDDSESIVADYWISFCYYRLNNQPAGLAILEPLVLRIENNRYLWMLSRLFYLKSLIHFKLNEHSRAIDSANRAGDLARQTNDKVGLVNAFDSLMEFHRYLGDYQSALHYAQQSFGIVDSIALDPVQGARHYGLLAIAFASADLFAASADSQHLALEYALQSDRSAAISANYSFLGLTQWKLGNYREALRNSQRAYDTAKAHAGGSDDQNLMAYASLQIANAARLSGEFDLAIGNYTRAIEIYTALAMPTHLYQAHKGRLLCYRAVKNDALAKDEISTAINLVEKYRNQVFEENTRERFFDTEQSIYDTAIEFEHSQKNNEQAFQYSENSRGRSLLDLTNRDTRNLKVDRGLTLVFESLAKPLSVSEIQLRLPLEVQLAQYAVLEDKLLIWVISRDRGLECFSQAISANELTKKVLGYLNVISKRPGFDGQSDETGARELFEILIDPIASRLDPSRQLLIVPDKVLNLLQFAALKSPVGRYLIQDYVLQISPSSTIFILCSEMARLKETGSREIVLSVGNPTFDRAENPQLPDLPAAAREANQVAKLYGSQNPLIEAGATATAASRAMGKSNVIHLALHSVLDERFPLRSKLLFAKAKPPVREVLSASDIYLMDLSRSRLVVLSACQTGAERYYKGEGMISLARPFIAARVPLVVATMWPVDSDSTAELMISFHQNRVQTMSTAQALAKAQREMLLRQDSRYRHPYYWASFTVIGGFAKF